MCKEINMIKVILKTLQTADNFQDDIKVDQFEKFVIV